MSRSLFRRLASSGPAVVVGAAFFGGWELAVRVLDIEEFLLPKPTSILSALRRTWGSSEGGTLGLVPLREAGFNTSMIAVSGLAMGVILGVALALAITRFSSFGSAVTPLAVALNATPIVALAPIFKAWFGLTSSFSNQAVVIAVVFFPVFVNTAKGLTEVHPNQLELMRSYGAPELTILRRVRIPNALPFFFASLRIAAPLSVIAAIVAEYFGGPLSRLGPVITQNASFARYDVAWAAIVVASAVGLLLFVFAVVAEKVAMPWKRPESES